ncbi:MAG: PmoA family protein [Fuerstiella sp.]|nr:PmoA family protein [Fuerstiella sp.]
MNRSALVLLLCPLLNRGLAFAADSDVKIVEQLGQLQVKIGQSDFATYNYSSEFRKPFFLPVRAADGTILTRALDDPEDKDHAHHKGVWVAVDEVNEARHWKERELIVTRDVTVLCSKGNPAVFTVTNEWQKSGADEPVVTEKTHIAIYANRLMTYEIQFLAKHGPVDFRDTKEGLFGYRMVSSMKEKNTGRVVSSDGIEGTADCWGRSFPWIDYSGTVGDRTYGVTLMDHPENFRPSRYHVRNYGLFSINPFGEHAYSKGEEPEKPVHLNPGENLKLRYAIYFHDGDAVQGNVEQAYRQFTTISTVHVQ